MIGQLRSAKAAYFYRKKKRLSNGVIDELFQMIRSGTESPSRNVFKCVRTREGSLIFSALSFFHERDPVFLDGRSNQGRERICGFILLVEDGEYATVVGAGLELPSTFKTEYLERVGNATVEVAVAKANATFEKIILRNTATSKYALRSKTLEANDLQSVIGPAGASRLVPKSYRVRVGADCYSASPNTGRISLRSDRIGYRELINWCATVIKELQTTSSVSPFIQSFARAQDLGSIDRNVRLTYFAVDVATLSDELFEADEPIKLVRHMNDAVAILDNAQAELILGFLEPTLSVAAKRGDFLLKDHLGSTVGKLTVGKTRISLRELDLPEIDLVYVRPFGAPADGSADVKLKRYIDRNDYFTVLFSELALAYMFGTLYRDETLVNGGTTFLRYIRVDKGLNGTSSEKGDFSVDQTAFDSDSVFGVIVDSIGKSDRVLICDDLNDEWADFIGIDDGSTPKTISFYHGKHGDISLGASPFHVAVSQAIKNLGRLSMVSRSVEAKLPSWSADYSNDNVNTQIPRVLRGQPNLIAQTINEVALTPDTIRKAIIVTSSLSKRALEEEFNRVRNGGAPKPYFVQLYWLLTSFFSACSEVGAFGYIVCRE